VRILIIDGRETDEMRGTRIWLVGAAVVGAVAGMAALALFWLAVTEPVALAQALGRGF
jgi:hypothetical protein